ncbi:MAG TPA: helix-turn-helix transcriptional regulator [Methanocorpusculum sp.]|nr:helix-turn-helix transcriptional regulator [Methanocorpusculum sp.]
MRFGEKVHKLRKENGMTQAELAKILGVHHRTIIGYERDGRYPRNREVYQKLADIFHVPVSYLYSDEVSFMDDAAANYAENEREEAKQLAQELSELFATGELSAEDMDAIMFVMHRAYFQYREEKREKEKHEPKEA